jgi:aspartate/methionine/tyrosine aminotransferase
MVETLWAGRFPKSDFISLLDVNRRFNLAESTAQDLRFADVIALCGGMDVLGDLKLGYGSSAGLARLRQIVATQSCVEPDEVVTTQGTALGLFLLAFEVCRPGDEVVIATPCFPPSLDTLAAAGTRLIEHRLAFDDDYRLSAAAFVPLLSQRTRLVSIASPQNPSGVVTSLDEIAALLDVMRDKAPNALLFVDETYRDATHGPRQLLTSAASLDKRVITGASVSKAHGAPGLRCGWLTTRDTSLRARLITAKMNLVISGSTLIETLAAGILENCEAILGPRRTLLAEGVAIVETWVRNEQKWVEWVPPAAGALCCMRLRPDHFEDAQIARFWSLQLGDGAWFGESSRVFRLGFGYLPLDELRIALGRLTSVLVAAGSNAQHASKMAPLH